MNCVIRGLSQKMDFARDTMQTFLLVELPTGEVISALIEDAVAERVVAARVAPTKTRGVIPEVVLLNETSTHVGVIAPPAFPVDMLPPVSFQHGGEDNTQEPEQESDEDQVPSV